MASQKIWTVRLLLIASISLGVQLYAQSVEIKIVDGRNGKPMAGAHVNIWVGTQCKAAMAIATDKMGIAHLRLAHKDDGVDAGNQPDGCGSSGVANPVVKYSELIRVNVGDVLCVPHGSDYSWLTIQKFSSIQIIQHGIVTPNTCGRATSSAKPGEVVIFVRPLTWWEKWKQ